MNELEEGGLVAFLYHTKPPFGRIQSSLPHLGMLDESIDSPLQISSHIERNKTTACSCCKLRETVQLAVDEFPNSVSIHVAQFPVDNSWPEVHLNHTEHTSK